MLSVVSDSVTAGTAACQAPLSMGFSRQEHWRGYPFPSPGDLCAPESLVRLESPTLEADFLLSESPGKPKRFPPPQKELAFLYLSFCLCKIEMRKVATSQGS